jgi:hypothetical protein
MPKWLTGTDLMQRWRVQGVELFELVKKGLQPYNRLGEPQPPPDIIQKRQLIETLTAEVEQAKTPVTCYGELEIDKKGNPCCTEFEAIIGMTTSGEDSEDVQRQIDQLHEELAMEDINSWHCFTMPDDAEDSLRIISGLEGCLFLSVDVEAFEKTHLSNVKADPKHSVVYTQCENAFIKTGKTWRVFFNGKPTGVADLERIRYIVHLIDNPGERFTALELMTFVKKEWHGDTEASDDSEDERPDYAKSMDESEAAQMGEFSKTQSPEKIDKRTIMKAARKLLDEMNEAKERGIEGEIEKAEQKWLNFRTRVAMELNVAIKEKEGKLYVDREGNKDAERRRKNVSNQIVNAIKMFDKDLPDLAGHLVRYVHRGATCWYENTSMNWHIKF